MAAHIQKQLNFSVKKQGPEISASGKGKCLESQAATDGKAGCAKLATPAPWSPGKGAGRNRQQENQGCPLSPGRECPLQSPPLSPIKLNQVSQSRQSLSFSPPSKQAPGPSGRDALRSPGKAPAAASKPLVLKVRFFSSRGRQGRDGEADGESERERDSAAGAPSRAPGSGDLRCSALASPPSTPGRSPSKRPSSRQEHLSADVPDHSPRKISRRGERSGACDATRTPTKTLSSLHETTPQKTLRGRGDGELQSPRRRTPRKDPSPGRSGGEGSAVHSPRRSARRLDLTPPSSPRCRTPRKSLVMWGESSDASRTAECVGVSSPGGVQPRAAARDSAATPSSRCSKLAAIRRRGAVYQAAKQSLHTAKPSHLIGRDAEVAVLREFLEPRLQSVSPGSMYISGAPGTGKTAALMHVLDTVKEKYECRLCYQNCMALRDSASVYARLLQTVSGNSSSPCTDPQHRLEKFISSSKLPLVVVLDEVDQLDSRQQEVLYTLFEWPSLPRSSLILIGVANALDLTDRMLPRLQARPSCRPQLLNFLPYSQQQIAAILQDRLAQVAAEGQVVMEPGAVQFCARKISAIAGDARKALDVCHRAVERAERNGGWRSQAAVQGMPSPQQQQTTLVTIADVSAVLSEVYGSSVEAARQGNSSVPLQQKLLVCSLLLLLRHSRSKVVTLGQLHDAYCKVCKKRKVSSVDQSEFFNLCTLLEAPGIVGLKKAKEPRLAKVSLKLDEQELHETLKDRVLISSILAEGLPK